MPTTFTSPIIPPTFQALVPASQTLEFKLTGGIVTFRSLVAQFYSWMMQTCVEGDGTPVACIGTDLASYICQLEGFTTTTSTSTGSTTSTSSSTTTITTTSASNMVTFGPYGTGTPNPSRIAYTGPSLISSVTITIFVNMTWRGGPACSGLTAIPPLSFTLTAPDGTQAGLDNRMQMTAVSCTNFGEVAVTLKGTGTVGGVELNPMIGKNANGVWSFGLANISGFTGALDWTLSFT